MNLDELEAKVKAITSVKASAIALIQGLAERVRATAGDPAKVAALAAELDQDARDLGDAVVANTPSE